MPLNYIRKDLVRELKLLEPFGKGNEKPLFAQKGLIPRNIRVFGKNRNVVRMQLADAAGFQMTGIFFGDGDDFVRKVQGRDSISILYYPEIDEYQEEKICR